MLVVKFVTTGEFSSFQYNRYFGSNLVLLCQNHGDRDLNRRILDRLGYREFYHRIKRDFSENPFPYVLLNLTAVLDQCLRVSTNLFGENTVFAEFY